MTSMRWRDVAVLALLAVGLVPIARAEPSGEARGSLEAAASASSVPPAKAVPPSPLAAAPAARKKGAAKPKSFTDRLPCSACHTTTSWRARGASTGSQKFDHSQTGFPLTGVHLGTPCVGCHDAAKAIKRACVSCHDDYHRGRLSQSCDRCHSAAGWRMTRPIELHRLTRFPLTGMHALADCTECHRQASEGRFTDAPVACFACHEKDYRRTGVFPVHVGSATTDPLPRDCSLCHRAVAWVPAKAASAVMGSAASALTAAPPNHDLKFPISFGVHRTAACSDCHATLAVPRAVRCIGCHAHDPVRLVQQHREPVGTDGAACLGCHVAGARR